MIYIKDYVDYINEGLIKTYDPNLFIPNLEKSLKLLGHNNVKISFTKEKINIEISHLNLLGGDRCKLLIDMIISSICNIGGYFPSDMEVINLMGNSLIKKFDYDFIIQNNSNISNLKGTFESKFPEIETKIPSKLYHLSIKEYEKNMKKYGIFPKSKSKLTSHLDRIYVCKTALDCKNLIPQMDYYFSTEKDFQIYQLNHKKYSKNITPQIWEIDNVTNFIKKLYIDPNYINGYFILQNITPDKLKIIY